MNDSVKTIDTLIADIQGVLMEGVPEIPEDYLKEVSDGLVALLKDKFQKKTEERTPKLYFSNIGSPCTRKLWFEINKPETREELTPDAKLKFLYGDLVELMMVFLAKLSGHRVEGAQDRQELHGLSGRRDVVIDGVLTDVKSASTFSYKKFADHTLEQEDSFGYLPQLKGYLEASQNDPIVTDKSRAAFLAVDKTLGHFCLDFHDRPDWDWKAVIEYKQSVISSETPPERSFEPKPDGYKNYKTGEFVTNGNEVLGTVCSYCSVKQACYDNNIRTFLSSSGPKYFTKIVKEPKMFEVVSELNK
jgi:hypothetical protein